MSGGLKLSLPKYLAARSELSPEQFVVSGRFLNSHLRQVYCLPEHVYHADQ